MFVHLFVIGNWGLRFGVCICICEYVIFVEDVRYCLVVSLCCVI